MSKSCSVIQDKEIRRELHLAQMRDRYYPGWWTYSFNGAQTETAKPIYRVMCRDERERQVAAQVKPVFIRAEIVIGGGQ
jgi:hypothetical protein